MMHSTVPIARRVMGAEIHNEIANLAEVKPWFGHVEGAIDLTPVVEAENDYVFLVCDRNSASIFEWNGPHIWQVHYLFAPSCRGRKALDAAIAMRDWMVREMGAVIIWGQTPVHNKGARWLNRQLGAKSCGFRTFEADGHCELFRYEVATW